MNYRITLISLITSIFLFSLQTQAITKRQLLAEDPQTKTMVARYEFSPFPTMTLTSYLSALGTAGYFAPNKKSPDYQRKQVEDMNGAAGVVILAGGVLNMFLGIASSPSITPEERAKLGTLSPSDFEPEERAFQKKSFLISHIVNTAAIAAVASQSVREDRWSVVAIQAVLPFAVDLSARYIFGSKKVSPWAFSVFPKFENGTPVAGLTFVHSW